MNKILPFIFLIFSFSKIYAQSGAKTACDVQNLISFGIPTQCGVSTPGLPFVGYYNNASFGSEKHTPFFPACNPTNTPVNDIWFKFIATSNSVKIRIDSTPSTPPTIKSPQLTIYQSTNNCKQPKPIQCFSSIPNSGFLEADINELIPAVPYYIQISGDQLSDTGNFKLTVIPYDSCTCLENATISLDPLPVAGYYPPGEKVTVCISVIGYNSSVGNGLHGIVPLLGAGWDITSITNIINTPSIDQQGTWSFYPNISTPVGPKSGFFYERNGDLNPANNLGDYGTKNDLWVFCFDIKTKSPTNCSQDADLSVKFELFSDGQTGSNNNSFCYSPNTLHTMAKLNCCNPSATLTTTPADCNESCDGSAIINLNTGFSGPYLYEWFDVIGSPLQSSGYVNFTSDTLKNACVLNGDYSLHVSDSTGCSYYKAFNIFYPIWQILPQQQYYSCPGECLNTASITNLSTHNFSNAQWYNPLLNQTYYGNLSLTDSICAGFYEVRIEDTINGCSRDYEWFIFDSPPANPFFSYPKNIFCPSDAGIRPDSIATGGGYFYSAPGGYVDSLNGTLLLGSSSPTNITIYYVTGGNTCKDTLGVPITVSPSPPPPTGTSNYTSCSFDTVFMNVSSGGAPTWYDQPYSTSAIPFANGTSAQHQFFNPGTHLIYVYNESGTCRSLPFIITVTIDEGTADAGPDIEICAGNSTLLNATGGNNYLWIPSTFLSDDKSPNPTCTPDSSISYLLKVISQSTCPGYDTLKVTVINSNDCIDIKPVNAFSPNSDGVNDYWFIGGIENSENEVSIFNRWGELVWKTKNYNNSSNSFAGKDSNGELLTATTYFYLISINNVKYTGWIEIVR